MQRPEAEIARLTAELETSRAMESELMRINAILSKEGDEARAALAGKDKALLALRETLPNPLVCDEFEICDHVACNLASAIAIITADALALTPAGCVSPAAEPETQPDLRLTADTHLTTAIELYQVLSDLYDCGRLEPPERPGGQALVTRWRVSDEVAERAEDVLRRHRGLLDAAEREAQE